MITKLRGYQIFVFGSNLRGAHVGGAALQAKEQFGAQEGVSEGMTGQSYAFPTLDENFGQLSSKDLKASRDLFYACAISHPEAEFVMTKVGCGIAGYLESEMRELFKNPPKNVALPKDWRSKAEMPMTTQTIIIRKWEKEFDMKFCSIHPFAGEEPLYVAQASAIKAFISSLLAANFAVNEKEIRRQTATEILEMFREEVVNKYYLLPNQGNQQFPSRFAKDLETWQQHVAHRFTNWNT
jgi:hypothetical protein